MQEAAAAKAPLALFGLTCSPHGSKCEFKPSQSFFWEKAEGAYAKLQRLQNEAPDVLQATCTSITAEWTPSSTARDQTAELATHTVCGCLAAFLCSSAGGEIFTDEALGQQDLFQINHCYVEVPRAGETVVTNDCSRLWLHNVRIRDTTGSMTVAVREKAALALSGCDSTASFQAAHRTNNLSYRSCAACASKFQNGRPKMVVIQILPQ